MPHLNDHGVVTTFPERDGFFCTYCGNDTLGGSAYHVNGCPLLRKAGAVFEPPRPQTVPSPTGALSRELAAFTQMLPGLLGDGLRGEFLLVHVSGHIVNHSVWPTLDAALQAGYERFGTEPFLVREITDSPQAVRFSRGVVPGSAIPGD